MQPLDDPEHGKEAVADTGDVAFLHGSAPPPEPLPRGQHDLSPEYVAEHQRVRIQEATTYVLSERGYGPATIGDIVARAHVSRRTFYDHFETKDHCVLATYAAAVECIADTVRVAYESEEEWPAAVAAAFTELMRVLKDYPHTAKTVFVEIRSVGAAATAPLNSVRRMATASLGKGIADRAGVPRASDLALEVATGGLIAVIHDRLATGDEAALERELPDITRAVLEPLVGPEATDAVVGRLGRASEGRAAQAI